MGNSHGGDLFGCEQPLTDQPVARLLGNGAVVVENAQYADLQIVRYGFGEAGLLHDQQCVD